MQTNQLDTVGNNIKKLLVDTYGRNKIKSYKILGDQCCTFVFQFRTRLNLNEVKTVEVNVNYRELPFVTKDNLIDEVMKCLEKSIKDHYYQDFINK